MWNRMNRLVDIGTQASINFSEFYFKLVQNLIIAGLIGVTAAAYPNNRELAAINVVTVWMLIFWTFTQTLPWAMAYIGVDKTSGPRRFIYWAMAVLLAFLLTPTLLLFMSQLASGLVK